LRPIQRWRARCFKQCARWHPLYPRCVCSCSPVPPAMQQPSLSFNQLKTARCCAQLERPQQKYVIAAMLRAASNPVVAAAAAATGQLHQVLQEAQQWHQSSNGLAVGLLCMQPQFSGAIAHAASSTMLPAVLQAFATAKVLDACFDTLTLSAAQASQLGGLWARTPTRCSGQMSGATDRRASSASWFCRRRWVRRTPRFRRASCES